jgi:hypothetical protein
VPCRLATYSRGHDRADLRDASPQLRAGVPLEHRRRGGLHLLAGTIWFLISVWSWLDRYLFCSDEPGWLGALLLVMAAMWVCGAILIGWVRSRGEQVWHWAVAWLALSTFVFMIALYSGPEPVHCGLF